MLALSLVALLLASAWAMCAAEADELALPGETEWVGLDGLDTDAAFEDYVNRLFGIGQRPGLLRALSVRILGAALSDLDRAVYDLLKAQIAQVATGERASTVFEVTAAELGLDGKYYAEDLGVESVVSGSSIVAEAAAAMQEKAKCDFNTIFKVLLRDCPYELYWCDKTSQTLSKGFGIGGKWDKDRKEYYLYFDGNMTFSFPVAEAYSAGVDYTVDTDIARTASTAAENALAVVAGAPSEDVEKLHYYKEWICENVSYNSAAAAGGVSYGDPWQLIWVFDGDSETNVVCEGYAKAFQYLCSKSDFASDIDSRIATGQMNYGNHMWNIVELPNGKNYMVDVTNCDGNSIGAPDKLFLAGTPTGSVDDGYTFDVGLSVLYTYDDATRSVYDDGELALSEMNYADEVDGVPIVEAVFPDPAFQAFVAGYDADGNGMLDADECAAVTAMDCSGLDIEDLTGIGVFTGLETLDCSDNALEALDLAACPALTSLRCQGNRLTTLDIADSAPLKALATSQNLTLDGGSALYQAGNRALAFDIGVRLVRSHDAKERLTLPADVASIHDEAFAGTATECVVIPAGCAAIGGRAFADCDALVEVWFPAGIAADAIAEDAFAGSEDALIVTDDVNIRAWAVAHGMLWCPEY